MIHILKAEPEHVEGIVKVCSDANRATYKDIYSEEYIERVIKQYYTPERILEEVSGSSRNWGGYFVAVDNGTVVGAGGGGMTGDTTGEIYVLYMDPVRRGEGIGSQLLEAITSQQKEEFQAGEQWVSVQQGNTKGIPFYEAKGFTFKHEEPGHGNEEAENYISLRFSREI
ncbi:GNAT family N-acetyltransferase [Rossellomorea aquimaris]|uniref:GNAT family N-acetyltransferase n=1 Tax=Rossellomorea aquimaris TaxID=189382 RepID=A0A5D4TM48_9BACI|nr:GNAT family N-acetyltransferase [Rossellomorea aquimaris]TYS76993.1 GNAT family N-acetyltransferase [Rossellomorea aquimaris]